MKTEVLSVIEQIKSLLEQLSQLLGDETPNPEPEPEPEPEPTPTPEPETTYYNAIVLANALNVRDQPSIRGRIVRSIPVSTSVVVDKSDSKESDGYIWYKLASEDLWLAYRAVNSDTLFFDFRDKYVPKDVDLPDYEFPHEEPKERFVQFDDDGMTVLILDKPGTYISLRSIGTNNRGLAYEGTDEYIYRYSTEIYRRECLKFFAENGVRVIRFYAPHKDVDAQKSIAYVKKTLDLLNDYGYKAILVLSDAMGLSGHIIPGTEQYHTQPLGHLDIHSIMKYYNTYEYYTGNLLSKVGSHPALVMVEILNEFAIHPQPATLQKEIAAFEFIGKATEHIKNHTDALVSSGLVNTVHIRAPQTSLEVAVGRLLELGVDIMSVHCYIENGNTANAAEYRRALEEAAYYSEKRIPYIVGEFGVEGTLPDRLQIIQKHYTDIFTNATAFLYWTLEGKQDVGNGDRKYGIRPQFSDYNLVWEYIKRTNCRC